MKSQASFLIAALLCSATVFADINVHASAKACENISGTWSGSGTVIAGPIVCHYQGNGVAKNTSNNTFTFDVSLKKIDGMCPDDKEFHLNGTCDKGDLHIENDFAKLHGSLNDEATSAILNGEVYYDILGQRITAQVQDMKLNKQ